jgi:hypothetical protein
VLVFVENKDYVIRRLKKANRKLSKKVRELQSDLKVDVKSLRAEAFKEGYETCQQQNNLIKLNKEG